MGSNIEENMENVLKAIVKTAKDLGFDDFHLYSELLNGEFVLKTFFKSYFEKMEGRACSSDKASYVVSQIKESIKLKQDLSLQITYGEYQEKGGNIGGITELDEICYWCPKTISNTKEALSLFLRLMFLEFKFIPNEYVEKSRKYDLMIKKLEEIVEKNKKALNHYNIDESSGSQGQSMGFYLVADRLLHDQEVGIYKATVTKREDGRGVSTSYEKN